MTRISSFGHSQSLVNSLLRNQSSMFETQGQIASGKKADDFRGVAKEAATLLGAKSLQTRTTKYTETLQQINQHLEMNNVQLEAIESTAQSLRQSLVEMVGQEEAAALPELLEETFSSIVTSLNTKIGANYIFSGSKVDTPPVNASSIADLMAAPNAAALFVNDDRKSAAKTGDNSTTEYGLLANDIGEQVFDSLKRIADFNAGPSGPLNGKMDATQRAFLETEISNLITAIGDVQDQTAANGLRIKKSEELVSQYQVTSDFLEVFVSDIEDTDLTVAITKLNSDQLALEASYNVMGQLSRLSLLNFL